MVHERGSNISPGTPDRVVRGPSDVSVSHGGGPGLSNGPLAQRRGAVDPGPVDRGRTGRKRVYQVGNRSATVSRDSQRQGSFWEVHENWAEEKVEISFILA